MLANRSERSGIEGMKNTSNNYVLINILDKYIVEHTCKTNQLVVLVSKLQTIINNTQKTIQKALLVYFCSKC